MRKLWALPVLLASVLMLSACVSLLPPMDAGGARPSSPKEHAVPSYRANLAAVALENGNAVRLATEYARLPRCAAPPLEALPPAAPAACSKASVVAQLGRASKAAREALQRAQALGGAAAPDAQSAALAQARAATAALARQTPAGVR